MKPDPSPEYGRKENKMKTTAETILARIQSEAMQHSERELHEQWDDCLDECTDEVKIGTLRYTPSHALKAVDPIAYRCGFVDWLDSESERIVEIEGEYYDRESVEKTLDDMETEADDGEGNPALLSEIKAWRKANL